MKKAWTKIRRFISENRQHRRGYRLQECSFDFLRYRAIDEFRELQKAPDDPNEMADLLAILFHYSIKQGWTEELLESYIIEKLDSRFKPCDGNSQIGDKSDESGDSCQIQGDTESATTRVNGVGHSGCV